MKKEKLSLKEVESLPYYDFMSYMGASFFQLGGPRSMDRLARQCAIGPDSQVLEVGCGTGFISCRLAEKFGCRVTGVDIAEVSIEIAKERARKEGLEDRVEFRVGDAYDLPFEDDTFDAVITGFVSMFLDMDRALSEFRRVIVPGGYVGINEMYKDGGIPDKEGREIQAVEDMLNDLTGLPFRLNTPEEWEGYFHRAGFTDIWMTRSHDYMGIKDTPIMVKEMGGWAELVRVLLRMVKYSIISSEIRSRFSRLSMVKKVFMRKKATARHVGYVLGTGRKPSHMMDRR